MAEQKQYLDKDGLEQVLQSIYSHLYENFPTKDGSDNDCCNCDWEDI